MQTGALIVAAGKSSRMVDFKPMLQLGSISIAQRVINSSKVLLVNIMTITIVISQPMKWMISIWKIPIASLIVPGNLNIRGNRNCKKNILFNPGKNRTTQNYNV